jgi:hypothetical protein
MKKVEIPGSTIIVGMSFRRVRCLLLLLVVCVPRPALAQLAAPEQSPASSAGSTLVAPPLTADSYTPITGKERVGWIVSGTIGMQSLLVIGPLAAGWNTALNTPSEWGQTWSGFGKRYAQRLADVAISSTIEGGLGALWGEDPRYIPSGKKGIWPRARYAVKTVVIAPRPDGSFKPAWGRYAGNVFNNIIENSWLPPSQTTASATAWRSVGGLLGRLGGNLWGEYWPDVQKRLFHRK